MEIIKSNAAMEKCLQANNKNPGNSFWYKERQTPSRAISTTPDYKRFSERLKSFQNYHNWSSQTTTPCPRKLSEAGLYYTGPGDRVQCAFCGGGLYNWESGDNAILEHYTHFGRCPYVQDWIKKTLSGESSCVLKDIEGVEETLQEKSRLSEEKVDGLMHGPVVEIVRQLGYKDDRLLEKALAHLIDTSAGKITCAGLLDKIYEIEANDRNYSSDGAHHKGGACNIAQFHQKSGACNITEETVQTEMLHRNKETNNFEDVLGRLDSHRETNSKDVCEPKSMEIKNTLDSQKTTAFLSETKISEKKDDNLTKFQEIAMENRRLKQSKICKVCLDREADILFLPCRHLGCCERCADSVSSCPVCRAEIVATVKTYLS